MRDNTYYYEDEMEYYGEYILPKKIFSDKYAHLSHGSILVYTILLDRLILFSLENNWIDDDGAFYIEFKREDIANILKVTTKSITEFLKELNDANLILEKRRGQGESDKIYIGRLS